MILIDETKGNEIQKSLESIKWKLWHGQPIDALAKVEKLSWKVTAFEKTYSNYIKLIKHISEFFNYISRNMAMVVDYGKRWREGRRISSAFIESLVNSLLNKRFCKRQQMQWKKQNAHLLLQVRVNVINDELAGAFKKWYPDFSIEVNDNKVSAIQCPNVKSTEMSSVNATQINLHKVVTERDELKAAA